VLIRIS
jgi:hypothetical protein